MAPDTVAQINWQGRLPIGDTFYCQPALCRQVIEVGGEYQLIVKEKQPRLLADSEPRFAPLRIEESA